MGFEDLEAICNNVSTHDLKNMLNTAIACVQAQQKERATKDLTSALYLTSTLYGFSRSEITDEYFGRKREWSAHNSTIEEIKKITKYVQAKGETIDNLEQAWKQSNTLTPEHFGKEFAELKQDKTTTELKRKLEEINAHINIHTKIRTSRLQEISRLIQPLRENKTINSEKLYRTDVAGMTNRELFLHNQMLSYATELLTTLTKLNQSNKFDEILGKHCTNDTLRAALEKKKCALARQSEPRNPRWSVISATSTNSSEFSNNTVHSGESWPAHQGESEDAEEAERRLQRLVNIREEPQKITELVGDGGLKIGHWVQAAESSNEGRQKKGTWVASGEWGKIMEMPNKTESGVKVNWDGGLTQRTECQIMDYCKPYALADPNAGEKLRTAHMRLRKLVILRCLKQGWWVQTAQGSGLRRHRGQWGQIAEDPEHTDNRNAEGKIRVNWINGKGSRRVTQTRCKIMNYRKEEPKWHPEGDRSDKNILLKKPMTLGALEKQLRKKGSKFGAFQEGDWIQTTQAKKGRLRGECGIIVYDNNKIKVRWPGSESDVPVSSDCKIVAYGPSGLPGYRRRLSPCEKLLHDHRLATPYRDPPVLTRLLKEIREANEE